MRSAWQPASTALSLPPGGERPGEALQRALGGAATVLTHLAAALSSRPGARAPHLAAASSELDRLAAGAGDVWQWAGAALLGQLRSLCRVTGRLNDAEGASGPARRPHPIRVAWSTDARLTVRASIGTQSESGRHALRLAVVCALAQMLALASGLSHGYWLALTVFIVLRPDYSSTLYRGLQRAAGTVAGAGLGVATALLMKVSLTALLAGIAVSLMVAYAVFTVNYLMFAVFLTDFVVVLLALLGLPPDPTALARLVGTGIGTGLAIVAFMVWPSWEGASAAEKFARLIITQGRYASTMLRSYAVPGADARHLRQLQLTARRARSDAEASADRLAGEPGLGPVSAATARALESVGHRMAQANLTLRAAVAAHRAELARDPGQQPADGAALDLTRQLDALAGAIGEATSMLAEQLRVLGSQPPRSGTPPAPDVEQLRRLLQALGTPPGQATGVSGSDGADAIAQSARGGCLPPPTVLSRPSTQRPRYFDEGSEPDRRRVRGRTRQ